MTERLAIAVQGIVQGVGFRPFIYGLATQLELAGFVKNRIGDVLIEVEGERRVLDQFLTDLANHPPPLANIDRLEWHSVPRQQECGFRIHASEVAEAKAVFVSPDVATCDDCLAELFDPADRRFRYAFLNCTHCGPRLTIIQGAPYDRARTTMAPFAMCVSCRVEYEDPRNRRFHAQPICCPACGPQLRLMMNGQAFACNDPVASFAAALLSGQIGALKGLGGYHLTCDARSSTTVSELRRRKVRDEKPFAVMVANISAVEPICHVSDAERALLVSRRRPIVLLQKRAASCIADAVAPGNPTLGMMLPYTPLHHLLLREVGIPPS